MEIIWQRITGKNSSQNLRKQKLFRFSADKSFEEDFFQKYFLAEWRLPDLPTVGSKTRVTGHTGHGSRVTGHGSRVYASRVYGSCVIDYRSWVTVHHGSCITGHTCRNPTLTCTHPDCLFIRFLA